jgi:hypothetical protein
LVNGSPIVDFNVGNGFRQGDPLSPFLFLIVIEGLAGLMRRAMEGGHFTGYEVCNNLMFHTLQYADDTIIVGEGNWKNLWTIKTVLRSFSVDPSKSNPKNDIKSGTWWIWISKMKNNL